MKIDRYCMDLFDPRLLPSVALADRGNLPQMPAVYFAIDASGVIRYVGKTKQLCRRWNCNAHHRLRSLEEMGGVRIHYAGIFSPTSDESREIERQLIRRFKPSLNLLDNPCGELYSKVYSKEAMAARTAKSVESNRAVRLKKKEN